MFMSTNTNQKAPDQRKRFLFRGLAIFIAGLAVLPILFLAFIGYLSFDPEKRWLKQEIESHFAKSTGQQLQFDGGLAVKLSTSPSVSGDSFSIKDQQGTELLQAQQVDLQGSLSERSINLAIARAIAGEGQIADFKHNLLLGRDGQLEQSGSFRLDDLDPLLFYSQLQKMISSLPAIDYPSERNVLRKLQGSITYSLKNDVLELHFDPLMLDASTLTGTLTYNLLTTESTVRLNLDKIELTDYVAIAGEFIADNKSAEKDQRTLQEILADIHSKGEITIGVLIYQAQRYEKVSLTFE
jgi:hypothetical protein